MFDDLKPVTCQCRRYAGRSKDGGTVAECWGCSDNVERTGFAIVNYRATVQGYLGFRWPAPADSNGMQFGVVRDALRAAGFRSNNFKDSHIYEFGKDKKHAY